LWNRNNNSFKEINLTRVKHDETIDLMNASDSLEKVVITHCRLNGIKIKATPNLKSIHLTGSWNEDGRWSDLDQDTLRNFLTSTVLNEVILVEIHCVDVEIDLGKVLNRMDKLNLTFCCVKKIIPPNLGVRSLAVESHNFYEWPTRLANPWGQGTSLVEIYSLFQPGVRAPNKVELRWVLDERFCVTNTILDHNNDYYMNGDLTIESCKLGNIELRDRQTIASIPDEILDSYV